MHKRIAHITDTHLDDITALDRGINPRENFMSVLDAIATIGADEIVCTGDIGETEANKWFFEKLEEYSPAFKVTLGNHDNFEQTVKYFKTKSSGKNELYYSNEDEFYKYIYLDSSSAVISEAQLSWLQGEVATVKKIIIFVHHPILGVATEVDTMYPLHNREDVAVILQQCKHQVHVFCGHYHMPDKRTDGKIVQHITPAVSFQVKKFSSTMEIRTANFGFRIITITETSVKTTLYTNNYDYFSPSLCETKATG